MERQAAAHIGRVAARKETPPRVLLALADGRHDIEILINIPTQKFHQNQCSYIGGVLLETLA